MDFFYRIYGLNIESSRRITILNETDNVKPDLTITWLINSDDFWLNGLSWSAVNTTELSNRKLIAFFNTEHDFGRFLKVTFKTNYGGLSFILNPDKSNLFILYSENEPRADLESYFVGTMLGCVLRLMGVMCLHSSAVNINGKAILLVGVKRSGKSTTAATFAKMGYKILCDDVAAIRFNDGKLYVEPGYAKLRLRPRSAQVLHPESLDIMTGVFTERDSKYADVSINFQDEALPLGTIYFLGGEPGYDKPPVIEPVLTGAMYQLHGNTFANYIITQDMRKSEFDFLATIVARVPIKLLKFGHDVKIANLQCEAIITDQASSTINFSNRV